MQALRYQPVAVDGMHSGQSWQCEGQPKPTVEGPDIEFSPWDCTGVPWFSDPDALDRPLTDGGPASWQHASPEQARAVAKKALPKVDVSNVRTTESSVAFDVSRTSVPVMVKTSYYPNWQVEGAKGPWRATPNFMVVVPTSKHVKLTFETATVDWVGRVLTLVGLLGLGGLVWWGIASRRRRRRAPGPDATPDAAPDAATEASARGPGDPDGDVADDETSRANGSRRRVRFRPALPR